MYYAEVLKGSQIDLSKLSRSQKSSLGDFLGVKDVEKIADKFSDRTWSDFSFPAIMRGNDLVSFVSLPSKAKTTEKKSADETVALLSPVLEKINRVCSEYEVKPKGTMSLFLLQVTHPLGELCPGDVYSTRSQVGISFYRWPTIFREESLLRLICMNGAIVNEDDMWWSQAFSEAALNRYINVSQSMTFGSQALLSRIWNKLNRPADAISMMRIYSVLDYCEKQLDKDFGSTKYIENMLSIWNKYQPVVDIKIEKPEDVVKALSKQPSSWLRLAVLDGTRKYDVWNDGTYAVSRYGEVIDVEFKEVRGLGIKVSRLLEDTEIIVPQLRQ